MDHVHSLQCSQETTKSPTLCQMNLANFLPFYIPKINLKLSTYLCKNLPKSLFPSGFPAKILYKFLLFHAC